MKIFFIDIDNTLIYKGNMPRENLQAISRARAAGNLVILNTGRSYEYIPWDVIKGVEYDGAISGLGAYVLFGGKAVYSNPIPREKSMKLVHMFMKNGKWIKHEGENKTVFQNFADDRHRTVCMPEEFLEACGDAKISKFTCEILSDEESDVLSEDFEIYNYDTYSEGSVKGTSKKKGIKILLDYLGKTAEDCVALGDSINDIGMFEMCAQSAAMGNACDEVKKLSTYIARDAADGGVADAIEHFAEL